MSAKKLQRVSVLLVVGRNPRGGPMSRKRRSYEAGHKPKYLVIIDESAECDRAVYYGSRRAARTGAAMVMLLVIEPRGRITPERVIRDGDKAQEILNLIGCS